MDKTRAVNFTVEPMESGRPQDSHAVARVVVDAMIPDGISRRNAEIHAIIADCDRLRRAEAAGRPAAGDDTQRRQIETQIAELQRQLREMAAA